MYEWSYLFNSIVKIFTMFTLIWHYYFITIYLLYFYVWEAMDVLTHFFHINFIHQFEIVT